MVTFSKMFLTCPTTSPTSLAEPLGFWLTLVDRPSHQRHSRVQNLPLLRLPQPLSPSSAFVELPQSPSSLHRPSSAFAEPLQQFISLRRSPSSAHQPSLARRAPPAGRQPSSSSSSLRLPSSSLRQPRSAASLTYPNPLQDNHSYSAVKQYFVNEDDTVAQQIIVHKNSPGGTHFRRVGPRQKVYFESDEVHASIVTCGGLCPGINTVIREIVCGLYYMYGVNKVLGIEGGYRGFYSRNTIPLTPKVVDDIHKRGGTILGTSRGGHETSKIVDSIQDRGITQVYIIGGDGTQKGASVIFEEIKRRGLKVAVAGIPKTIDNDIPVIDKSFGFDTGVEEAQRAINAAHVEAESFENGVGVVKLMGRYSGFIAMYATLASRDVDCCLIPESPFYLEGPGGLFEFMEKRLKENGHMVIVIAEGAGQELLSESMHTMNQQDASGNKLLQDVGLWISQKIKDHFNKRKKVLNLKYIDPTYMIRAIPSIASDNVSCTLLAHSAIHGAMAGYTGFTVGPVNGKHAYIPFYRVTERQNKVVITDRMWARLLSSTNQPSFLNPEDIIEAKKEEQPKTQLLDGDSVSDEPTSKENGK